MKETMRKAFWWILIILAFIILSLVFSLALPWLKPFSPANVGKSEFATSKDVRFILNWCELGESRIDKVVHSYKSKRALCGDHFDAYAIKITHISPEELSKKDPTMTSQWYRGDKLPEILSRVVDFIGIALPNENISWAPSREALRSKDFYVYPVLMEFHGLQATRAEIIFVRPSNLMLFFFSFQT